MAKSLTLKKLFSFIILIVTSAFCFAQDGYSVSLNQTFITGTRESWRTADGGFAILSTASSGSSFILVRTDSFENVIWSKRISLSGSLSGTGVIETTDNMIVTLGTFSDSVVNGHILLTKYGPTGNVIWSRQLNSVIAANSAYCITPADSGGFVIAGGGCGGDNFVIRYDANCNIIWSYQYPNPQGIGSNPLALITRSNGHFTIAGFDVINSQRIISLFEVDENGSLLWYHNYDDGNEYWTWSLAETPGHEITMMGQVMCSALSYPNYMLKTDSLGNFLWMKQYTGSTPFCLNQHVCLSNESFVAVGSATYANSYNAEYFAMAIDYDGNPTLGYSDGSSLYNHSGGDWLNTAHGSGNSVFGLGEGGDGISVVRLDAWLTGFCDPDPITITTVVDTPIISDPPIVTYLFNVTMANYPVGILDQILAYHSFCVNVTTDAATEIKPTPEISVNAREIRLGSFNGNEILSLNIIDASGRNILQFDKPCEYSTFILPELSDGIYFVRLNSYDNVFHSTFSLVKE